LAEHNDIITPLIRGAPRLGLALGPAPAGAGPADEFKKGTFAFEIFEKNANF